MPLEESAEKGSAGANGREEKEEKLKAWMIHSLGYQPPEASRYPFYPFAINGNQLGEVQRV